MNPAYEPLIRRVTSVGCDMTTDEAVEMLDDLVHALAEQQRDYAENEWTGDDARMILRRRVARHLADLIDPEKP
ncbi:hypothetical protein [Streptomyces olivaceoviridis]|uniref:hypothetical protein n=1 Tax=Streptomyces olivaceoviridis TaxID=1921 RepID=UPI0036FCDD54